MHGKFPFPEATMTTEILITGEKGGKQVGILVTSGLIGGLYDFMFCIKIMKRGFYIKSYTLGEVLAKQKQNLYLK